jgi:SAM-dependent methyltransferase
MIKVITNNSLALESPDFLVQQEKNLKMSFSAAEDNSTSAAFIDAVSNFFANRRSGDVSSLKLNVLDLGCGGGQLIVDFSQQSFTNVCVGLDGVAGALGRENWLTYNMFHNVDLSKDYTIVDSQNEMVKFDLITSWEMIEHLHPTELDIFFRNMHKHLKSDGVFLGSIAMFPDIRDEFGYHQDCSEYNPSTKQYLLHQSVFDENTWKNKILKDYSVLDYPFVDERYRCGYLAPRDHPPDENGVGGSFYLMITK